MTWAAGTVLNERYIIAKEIGNGGFGLTYLAYKSDRTSKVAIKTLKDEYAFDPIWQDEFRKEILSLSKCNHPQIVTIEDFGDYKSGWFNPKSQPYIW
jgi:serine/threonine protein kinase